MSTPPLPAPPSVTALTNIAHGTLQHIPRSPFSESGFDELERKVDQYIDDLVLESVRIMQRRQADTISQTYVQQASDNLVATRPRKLFALIGTIGGILLGTAASSFLEFTKATNTISPTQAVTAGLLGVLGAVMVALQFSRE
jgi:hypothetical protein